MARPVETQMTISCLQCDWSVEAVNTSVQASSAFLEAAHAHANEHEQHAIEVVQRLRLYSENYVEPAPPAQGAKDTAARRDPDIPDRLPGQDPPPGSLSRATSATANERS